MLSSTNALVLSRVLVPLLGLAVWGIIYLHAKCAYRLPKSGKKTAVQLLRFLAAVSIFVLQINLMERLTPEDAYGSYFFWFITLQCGGGLVILFKTLLSEKAKSMKAASGVVRPER